MGHSVCAAGDRKSRYFDADVVVVAVVVYSEKVNYFDCACARALP